MGECTVKKEKFSDWFRQINWKDKNTYLVIGLIGALILVVAMPTGGTKKSQENPVSVGTMSDDVSDRDTLETQTDESMRQLELRLERVLSTIDGAGKVQVMITQKDYGQQIVEKDELSNMDTDATGQKHVQRTSESVFEKNSSEERPFVSRELAPQIEGVLVVAEGGANSAVKQNILQAVKSLFPLEAHKITVVKMSMQEDRLP